MVEVLRHHPLTEQLEAAHFAFHKAATMVTTPYLPDRATQAAGRPQNLVADIGARPIFLPELDILPRRYHCLPLPVSLQPSARRLCTNACWLQVYRYDAPPFSVNVVQQ